MCHLQNCRRDEAGLNWIVFVVVWKTNEGRRTDCVRGGPADEWASTKIRKEIKWHKHCTLGGGKRWIRELTSILYILYQCRRAWLNGVCCWKFIQVYISLRDCRVNVPARTCMKRKLMEGRREYPWAQIPTVCVWHRRNRNLVRQRTLFGPLHSITRFRIPFSSLSHFSAESVIVIWFFTQSTNLNNPATKFFWFMIIWLIDKTSKDWSLTLQQNTFVFNFNMSTPVSPFHRVKCTQAPLYAFFLSCQTDEKHTKSFTALEITKSTWLVCYSLMPILARRPATTSPFPPPIQHSFANRRVTLTTIVGVPSIIAAEKLSRFDIACSTRGKTCVGIDFPNLKSTNLAGRK